MHKCAICSEVFNDGVQCGGCNKHFGFCCASVSEANYRKLGPERRGAWRCSQCKANVSPRTSSSGTVRDGAASATDQILRELRELKQQLKVLPSLIEDVKDIKSELSGLKSSCEYNHSLLSDQSLKIAELEGKVAHVQSLEVALGSITAEVTHLKNTISDMEQRSRLNNIEIKGVPAKKTEDLFSIFDAICSAVGHDVPKSQVNYIARVPTQDPKKKSIIVSLHNRYMKDNFLTAARAHKGLITACIPGVGGNDRIYVNDHLTPANKRLLTMAKTAAKDKHYLYVWVKHCKIHVRKNDTSNVFIVAKDNDLKKIV